MSGALATLLLPALVAAPPETLVLEAEAFEVVELSARALAPEDDAERAVLSGGAWVADNDLGPRPRRLATTFTVTTTAAYTLYARTFWKHGPFAWRLDDGPARRVGDRRILLDCAVMRAHVRACWVRLGRRALAAGAHRLELVVEGGAAAVGFDVFQLTTSSATPRGRYGLVDAERPPPAAGWVRFDPGAPPSRAPVWQDSFRRAASPSLEARGGRLVRSDTGEPWPLVGVSIGADLASGAAPAKARFARFVAAYGANFVRIPSRSTRTWSPTCWISTATTRPRTEARGRPTRSRRGMCTARGPR